MQNCHKNNRTKAKKFVDNYLREKKSSKGRIGKPPPSITNGPSPTQNRFGNEGKKYQAGKNSLKSEKEN